MKDSAKLLNFNVNRDLKFSVFRRVDFDPRRELSFDLNRDLSFLTNRDLGFGKRGVVFRGYVCPVCRAPVAKDAPRCDECGVKFEQPAKKAPKKTPPRVERQKAQRKNPPAVHMPPPQTHTPQRRSTFECPGCGKILYVGVEQCPGCMTLFSSGANQVYNTPASGDLSPSRTTERQVPPPGAQTIQPCPNCGYGIPPQDRFCRRCGSVKPAQADRTLVSWDEYKNGSKDGGAVSWDEYSNGRKGG